MELDRNARTYIAGHRGLVGSALWRELERLGFAHLIGRTHSELDLRDSAALEQFYASEKPEYVFLAAAKVGGIYANDHQPAEFLLDNLQIQNNVIHGAHRHLRLTPFHGFGAVVEWFLHFFISADLPPFQKHAPRV